MGNNYRGFRRSKPDAINITNGDVVSGAMYRKLVDDYKAYDAKQKEHIRNQAELIKQLQESLKKYQKIPDTVEGQIEKIDNQRGVINQLMNEIAVIKENVSLSEYEKLQKIKNQTNTIKLLISQRDELKNEIYKLNFQINEYKSKFSGC